MIDNALSLDRFKFLSLEMSGSKVLAKLSESEGIWSRVVFTHDEMRVHDLLEGVTEMIRSGDQRRTVHKNYEQILAAFNAIRTYKAQNGIPLDVKEPCV